MSRLCKSSRKGAFCPIHSGDSTPMSTAIRFAAVSLSRTSEQRCVEDNWKLSPVVSHGYFRHDCSRVCCCVQQLDDRSVMLRSAIQASIRNLHVFHDASVPCNTGHLPVARTSTSMDSSELSPSHVSSWLCPRASKLQTTSSP